MALLAWELGSKRLSEDLAQRCAFGSAGRCQSEGASASHSRYGGTGIPTASDTQERARSAYCVD